MAIPRPREPGKGNGNGGTGSQQPIPPIGSRQYVELKTSALLTERRQHSFERYKLLKFWAQSFLLNVPTIVVGFRTDDGQVKKLQAFKTLEIPKLVRGKHLWVCGEDRPFSFPFYNSGSDPLPCLPICLRLGMVWYGRCL
jgi:hypothetical protein